MGPIPLGRAVYTFAGRLSYRATIRVAGINGLRRAVRPSIASFVDRDGEDTIVRYRKSWAPHP